MLVLAKKTSKQRGPFLHPEAAVYIIRPTESLPAKSPGIDEDNERKLSYEGILAAKRIGAWIAAFAGDFDQVIVADSVRARETAYNIFFFRADTPPLHYTKRRELYAPAEEATAVAFMALEREIKTRNAISMQIGEKLFEKTRTLVAQLKIEAYDAICSVPEIGQSVRIAIVCDPMFDNTVATALFPNHEAALKCIGPAHGDIIRLTRTTCQHFPVLY